VRPVASDDAEYFGIDLGGVVETLDLQADPFKVLRAKSRAGIPLACEPNRESGASFLSLASS